MKKIALVVDADNWAFANIAKSIVKYVKKYEFDIIPMSYLKDDLVKGFTIFKKYDLIHFFWRENVIRLTESDAYNWVVKMIGFPNLDAFLEEYVNDKLITTAVYDHLFIDKDFEKTQKIFEKCPYYYVSSNILNDIYQNMDIKNKPMCVITDGVYLDNFYPINIDRFNKKKNKLIVGWVGNSEWKKEVEDFKGVNTILKPAIKELQEEGYKIEEYFADRKVRMIPHDKMVDYYSDIDVLVCASKCEGTPNPVLEAMACGVPVISTRVGIVPDALGKKQSSYILEERSKECMKQLLKNMYDQRNNLNELSEENLKQIKKWEWKKVTKKFEKFFDEVFEASEK